MRVFTRRINRVVYKYHLYARRRFEKWETRINHPDAGSTGGGGRGRIQRSRERATRYRRTDARTHDWQIYRCNNFLGYERRGPEERKRKKKEQSSDETSASADAPRGQTARSRSLAVIPRARVPACGLRNKSRAASRTQCPGLPVGRPGPARLGIDFTGNYRGRVLRSTPRGARRLAADFFFSSLSPRARARERGFDLRVTQLTRTLPRFFDRSLRRAGGFHARTRALPRRSSSATDAACESKNDAFFRKIRNLFWMTRLRNEDRIGTVFFNGRLVARLSWNLFGYTPFESVQ